MYVTNALKLAALLDLLMFPEKDLTFLFIFVFAYFINSFLVCQHQINLYH